MSKKQCIARTAGPVRYQHSLLPQVQTSFPSAFFWRYSCSHCAGPTCGYACSVQALRVVLSRCRQHCLSQIAGPVRYQHSLLHQNQTSPQMCMMGKNSCSHCAGLTFGYACSVQAVLAGLGMSKQQCISRTAGPVRYQHSLLPQVQTSFPSALFWRYSCSHCAGPTCGYACSVQAVLADLGMSKQQCLT